ncbi:MAG: hypothetical protein H7222_02490 [Methylotenera sp.]|nr:hypothetical protein [Oligoflexia bacterium]
MTLRVQRITQPADFIALVQLRNRVYFDAGKSLSEHGESFEVLRDPSFHMLGLYITSRSILDYGTSTLVGAITVRVPEVCSATPFHWIPKELQTPESFRHNQIPQPSECIEIGRLFLLPEFRGTQAVIELFRAVHRVLRTHQRKYLIITSDDRLQRLYRKICFKVTGLSYEKKPRREDKPYLITVMKACHQHFGVYGLLEGPLKWCLFMKPVIDSLQAEARRAGSEYPLSWKEKLVYRIYSLFAPLASHALPRPSIPQLSLKASRNVTNFSEKLFRV